MNRVLLLVLALCFIQLTGAFAQAGENTGKDGILRKSAFSEPNPFINNTSFPRVFTELSNPVTQPSVSTGYYFVDSDDDAPDYWRPNPDIADTNVDALLWKKIVAGPRILDSTYWTENPGEGLRFFRNPALPASGSYFEHGLSSSTDSTDDAIAGPIPLKFAFYFNGIRYDSFYVSTNGIIALTNKRYFYNEAGERAILSGSQTAWDPMSMDWFARSRSSADGTGLDDPTPDNFGYEYSVCGNAPKSQLAGIRQRGGALSTLPAAYKTAVIAPFFGDMHLSQWNSTTRSSDNWGKVFYKRFTDASKLIIYFVNIAPKGGLNTPYGGYTGGTNLRPGDQNYISANGQVVLDRLDSSVTIIYENFTGVANVSGRGVPANTIFRYNTTVGVRGFARHVNYDQAGGVITPWAAEYEQYTHYFSAYQNPNSVYPHTYLAIRFKQWKNTLRVVDIQYRVRKQDANASADFTEVVKTSQAEDFELLAGEEKIGAIQPVAILQNLTNSIQGPQGVNFQKQDLDFRARFRIVNEATQKIVYNRIVRIDSACLALPDERTEECTGDVYVKIRLATVTKTGSDYTATPAAFPGANAYNGIPPYGFVQVYFPPFEPNEFVDNHLGRLRAYIIADPTNPATQEGYKDEWPFDDTVSVRLFVMKRLETFYDDVNEFHVIGTTPMPSVLKWVNVDGEVASADEVSVYPVSPRGECAAANNPKYKIKSPVIRLNRLTLDKAEPKLSPNPDGDVIRSFPIDMSGKLNSVLSLSIQRAVRQDDWARGWNDFSLTGPEPRTVVNDDGTTVWNNYSNSVARYFDEIWVEFAWPSPDGIQYITNIPDGKTGWPSVTPNRWRIHPRRGGAASITNMAAYVLYGAGGAMRGFLEADKDSSLVAAVGLRYDKYDDGIDYEYKKIFIPIPDTFINAPKAGAKNFRFRIKVSAYNHKLSTGCTQCIPDDDDPCFVDNVSILFPKEVTDIEVTAVKALWPYTQAPASQAVKIPISVRLSNNTSLDAASFIVNVAIIKQGDNRAVYCRSEQIPYLYGGTTLEKTMPTWDARKCGAGSYRIIAKVTMYPSGDAEPRNDLNYTDITLVFGDVFAYDPIQPANDVPDQQFTGISGRGLNLFGFNYGGLGNVSAVSGSYDENVYGAGYVGGSGSGQFAVKFEVYQSDTIYGYQAFFAPLSWGNENIQFSIYPDQGGQPATTPIRNTSVYKQRGRDDVRTDPDNPYYYDEYTTYLLSKPVILDPGTYWATVSQLSELGLELGASKSRVGMRITSIYIPPPVTTTNVVGAGGYHLLIDKNFRKYNTNGDLINNNFFAYENTKGSGQWVQFMPTTGNPAYAHLHHYGISPSDGSTATLSRGTWIPMIRPYFKSRTSGENPEYFECPEVIPVNLTYFEGQVRNSGIELFWETASEENNNGFYVERNIKGQDNWQNVTFIKGNGTTNEVHRYSYIDREVSLNNTYQYRLRQVDNDGSLACQSLSDVIEVMYNGTTELSLEPVSPNPFAYSTKYTLSLPNKAHVKLEVLDIFGNVVKTLVNDVVDSQIYQNVWDANDANGNLVPSGSYILRLTSGDQVKTQILNVVR